VESELKFSVIEDRNIHPSSTFHISTYLYIEADARRMNGLIFIHLIYSYIVLTLFLISRFLMCEVSQQVAARATSIR